MYIHSRGVSLRLKIVMHFDLSARRDSFTTFASPML